jgi:RecB family exonuclease
MHTYGQLRDRAAAFVAAHSATGPVLVLAQDRAAADDVARLACTGALLGVQRLGFRELAPELAADEMLRLELAPIGRIVREALAARVAAQTELTYLKPVSAFPGFPRALAATFEELRLNGIAPQRLAECGQSGPDLARLLAAYQAELAARQFADHALRVQLAIAALRLADTAVVALDLAPRTRLERDLLRAVLDRARAALDLRLSPAEDPAATSLDSLQRFLFAPAAVPPREPDRTVEIFSTSGEALECVEIARRIAASGLPFDETAILLRSPERHQPLVVEALRRADIPAHCTHGAARPDPAGRSFLALLHCAEEGLSASRFAEYLSLGQMREDDEPHTPAQWERLLVDAAVIGGPERWRTRLAGLRQELARRYREAADDALDRKLAALDRLSAFALPILDRLSALPRRAPWREWIDALAALAEFTLAEPARVLALLEELEPLAEIDAALSDVLPILAPRLDALRTPPEEARYGKVWVGGIEEARGLAFRHVFVPGVNEGLFPRPPAEDPLLWQTQRLALGIEIAPDDAELLRIAAACATARLSLSFSRLDLLTGRERVPSFYAFAAHRAAGGPETDVRQFEDRARAATETKIGWPAPQSPADAIDGAEFDLATLAPLAPGSAQYLNRLPGRAIQSLRARWMRWDKAWRAADGLIVEEIGSDALAPYRLEARAWSPSALQQYARCPYRFALHGIFGLRPAERPAAIQRLDPATRGQIYHEVQFRLLRDGGANALDRLDEILREVAGRWKQDLAPAIPQIWDAEIRSLRADLAGWLAHRAESSAGWTPVAAELSFGLSDPSGRDPASRPDPVAIPGVLLRGSIDLVERNAAGALRVVDHKTGRPPEPRPEMVGAGEVLQPALYALAAEALLAAPVASGRLYYSTIARNFASIDVPLNQWTRRRIALVLAAIDAALRDGFLPAAPRKDACKRCEYLPVCGPYEEERVAVKRQADLDALKELRGWR